MASISNGHLHITKKLAHEMNALSLKLSSKTYSKVDSIDDMLLARDITVEKKKKKLIGRLHEIMAVTFAIRKKMTKNDLKLLAERLMSMRKIVIKLRSLNQYLETIFLVDLNFLKIKLDMPAVTIKNGKSAIRDEMQALEYAAYHLISEAVMLDKRLLAEYRQKEKMVIEKEGAESKDLGMILAKETETLEHLEAKLPPPRHLQPRLLKEPFFTQWVSRMLALLAYLEHLCLKETKIFAELKKNKAAKSLISKKITHLCRESSRLLDILDEKSASLEKVKMDNELRHGLRRMTAAITL